MGRPINKKWFGNTSNDGAQLELTAKVPGKDVGKYAAVKQRGSASYTVRDDDDRNGIRTRESVPNRGGIVTRQPLNTSSKVTTEKTAAASHRRAKNTKTKGE